MTGLPWCILVLQLLPWVVSTVLMIDFHPARGIGIPLIPGERLAVRIQGSHMNYAIATYMHAVVQLHVKVPACRFVKEGIG